MLEAAYQGLLGILEPQAMMLMVGGVLLSSVFAALPGVGVLLILTVVLPFSLTMSPYHAIAFLLGMGAVSNTANTFPSVLIAVPGSAGSQATILDGYPMARKGEAKRAFGAAFMASAIGGVLGAIVLLASLPILRPLVLSFGSPEFFVLVLWGLSAIGVLSGKAPIKGLLAAILGLLIATVGVDEKTAIERFSLDTAYLWDGVNVILIGLGLFAVPELIDLAVRRTSISETENLGSGLVEGMKDVFRHWWLVVRCSAIGVWVGVLPGLGSSVADWFAYAHAVQTEKHSERFGTGDVRGVIAPESSNNAKEGGALIPTIAFGIPGSTSLAIILAAFVSVGIHPGSRMLTDQLHLTLAMVWVLVISNLMATSLAMGFAGTFARLSLQPFYVIVPITLMLCASASFAASYAHEDLYAFLIFSGIGYLMKLFDWPRPPVLVAVVLGFQMETYLWLSIARYDFAWLLRPSVLLLLALVVFTLMLPAIRKRREKARDNAPAEAAGRSPAENRQQPVHAVLRGAAGLGREPVAGMAPAERAHRLLPGGGRHPAGAAAGRPGSRANPPAPDPRRRTRGPGRRPRRPAPHRGGPALDRRARGRHHPHRLPRDPAPVHRRLCVRLRRPLARGRTLGSVGRRLPVSGI